MADFEDDNQPSTSMLAEIAEKRRKAAERQRRYREKLKNKAMRKVSEQLLLQNPHTEEQRRKNNERQRRHREKLKRMEVETKRSLEAEFGVDSSNSSIIANGQKFCFMCNRLYFENDLYESSSSNSQDNAQENFNSKICSTCYSLLNNSKKPEQGTPLDFDPCIPEEERRFYMKAYTTIDQVRDKKVHCTTCKIHIGTAPAQEEFIRMHPVLRVTHCIKCHDFYNSGEFSKGEDGSELYCRWCGQGGEVYCCSSCPYVFCKSCIVKNLTRGVVADIEQNENWSCFSCAPKILWPLRAQHWALIKFIEKQKKEIQARNLLEAEEKTLLATDRSNCCRQSKTKCGNMSDSVESIDSLNSRSSIGSSNPLKKPFKPTSTSFTPIAKRPKTSNDEVVCTPDVLSMLEPDCQITVSPKPRPLVSPITSTPKVLSVQTGYGNSTAQQNKTATAPPPLVLRNTEIQMRALGTSPIMRRTIVGQRAPSPGNGATTPVYHTINGYRIDLNSAALQDTFRLPNGKLIQVKRQGTATNTAPSTNNNWQQRATTPLNFNSRPVQITPAQPQAHYANITQQHAVTSATPAQQPQIMRFNSFVSNNNNTPVTQNGTHIQMINGVPAAPIQVQQSPVTVRPVILKHLFPSTPIGQARTQLQEQVFSAMDICQHLTGKIQTLTNSNAYKQARNYLEVKELYIHLSYLLTYAIGRYKSLQDKCITDMRQLGFGADADSLENGQLAADKQASDDEDNEIEIIEPKTDTINLDSDNEDEEPSKASAAQKSILIADTTTTTILKKKILLPANTKMQIIQPPNPIQQLQIHQNAIHINPIPIPKNTLQGTPVQLNLIAQNPTQETPMQRLLQEPFQPPEEIDFATAAQSFLASMLDVDDKEQSTTSSTAAQQRKQPRKKMTSKPNPTLIKQKLLLERERLEEMKRSDTKLKMQCKVAIQKAEEEYPYIKDLLSNISSDTKSDHEKRDNESSVEIIDVSEGENSFNVATTTEKNLNIGTDICADVDKEPTTALGTKSDTLIQNAIDKNASQKDELVISSSENVTEKSNNEQSESMNVNLNNITDVQKDKVSQTAETCNENEESFIVLNKENISKESRQLTSEIEDAQPMEVEDDDLVEYIEENIAKHDHVVNDNKDNANSVEHEESDNLLIEMETSEKTDSEGNTLSVSEPIKEVEMYLKTVADNKIASGSGSIREIETREKTDSEISSASNLSKEIDNSYKTNTDNISTVSNAIQEVEICKKIDTEDKISLEPNAIKETQVCEKNDSQNNITSISNSIKEVEICKKNYTEDKISLETNAIKEKEDCEKNVSEVKIASISNAIKEVEICEKLVAEDKISSVSDSIEEIKICEKTVAEDKIFLESNTMQVCEKIDAEDKITSISNSIKEAEICDKTDSEGKVSSVSDSIEEVKICEKTDTIDKVSLESNAVQRMRVCEDNDSEDKVTSVSDQNIEKEICKASDAEDKMASMTDPIKEDEANFVEIDETIMDDAVVDVNIEAEANVGEKTEEILQTDSIEGTQTESHTDDCSRTKDVEVTSTTAESETFLNSPDLFNDLIEVDSESMT